MHPTARRGHGVASDQTGRVEYPAQICRCKRRLKPCGVGECVEIPIVLPQSYLAVNDLVDRNNWVLRRLAVRRRIDHQVLVHDVDAVGEQQQVVVGPVSEVLVLRPLLSRLTMLSGPRAANVGPIGMSRNMQSSLTTVFTASQSRFPIARHRSSTGSDAFVIQPSLQPQHSAP
jgi:hypothetical protein